VVLVRFSSVEHDGRVDQTRQKGGFSVPSYLIQLAYTPEAWGAAKVFKTTPLLTVEEGVEAMRKAQEAGYRRPGG